MKKYGDEYKEASTELKEILKNDEMLAIYKTQLETLKDQNGDMEGNKL